MKRTVVVTASLTLAILVLAIAVNAQGHGKGQRYGRGEGKGSGDVSGRLYDVKTVETIRGEVVNIETIAGKRTRSGGVHLTVRTDKETLSVHLGPSFYLDEHKFSLAKGDPVEITGSRVTYEGNPALIAQKVTRGNDTLNLRDDSGIPQWAGPPRRNRM